MTKKVAVINDLSGLGRCSLTAAISVLSAMGIQACPFRQLFLAPRPNIQVITAMILQTRWNIYALNGKS